MLDRYSLRRRNRMNYNKNKSCVKRLHRLYFYTQQPSVKTMQMLTGCFTHHRLLHLRRFREERGSRL